MRRETLNSCAVTIRKHDPVYTCGDKDEKVYFIESGQIKLHLLSPEEKECLLDIHTAGGVFGELCLSGLTVRRELAIAMEETVLKQISHSKLFTRLDREGLFEGFVRYAGKNAITTGL